MTKLRKTEEEFREVMYRVLNPHFHMSLKSRADLLICALDLEFQEPEGVPEEEVFQAGRRLLTRDQSGAARELTVPEYEEAAFRHNAWPDLLGLARELERFLHGELGWSVPEDYPVNRLLARARDLLDRLEEARP